MFVCYKCLQLIDGSLESGKVVYNGSLRRYLVQMNCGDLRD